MPHTAETYREAALEAVALALELHNSERYGPAHFWAGLAVECMLRAYLVRRDRSFESRHDLRDLLRQSGFYDFIPSPAVESIAAAVGVVVQRWSNDHRYRPTRMIERWLRDRGLDRTIKGDRLKYSSDRIVDSAILLVEIGESRWTQIS